MIPASRRRTLDFASQPWPASLAGLGSLGRFLLRLGLRIFGQTQPGQTGRLAGWCATALLFSVGPFPTHAGSILREVYQGIPGGSVADLTSNPNYPLRPSLTNFVSDFFEAPAEFDENYGQRMHGYVVAPVTGDYTFWIASDDNGELYLSTDENPGNAKLIATVPEWTGSREWGKYPNQQSTPIRLQAGRGYYIRALQKEGGGGDNLAVRWLRPDGVDEAPISAQHLQPWGISFTPPVLTGQPADTSAVEGDIATFNALTSNFDVVAIWRRNGTPLAAPNSLTLNYGPVTMADQGALFSAVLTNRLGSTNTRSAKLTVLPDRTPPTVLSALNLGADIIEVTFSEPVSTVSGSNPAHYLLDGGLTVKTATPSPDGRRVTLSITPLTFGLPYLVAVSRVTDRAQAPNAVPPNSQAGFVARELVAQDLGTTGGRSDRLSGGAWNLASPGANVGEAADQLQFAWERRTGNFDVQVRLAGVTGPEAFSHAGLMARATLTTNSAFAAVFGSSLQVGCFFESRPGTGNLTTTASIPGGFPANPPQTWLRLRRSGNAFTGFASHDGQTWVQLGSASVSLPSSLFFGLTLAGGNASTPATAEFRDLGPTLSFTTGPFSPTREPLGPTDRRTGLVITELMYHGVGPQGPARDREFVELYNADPIFAELGGWRLSGDIEYTFPAGTVLAPGEFLAVAADPSVLLAAGAPRALGPYVGTLSHSSGTVRLTDGLGAVKLELNYGSRDPWPVATDGSGHSLVLARPSYGLADARAWAASERRGGSPGRFDTLRPNPLAAVVINEFSAHPLPPEVEFIELYNHANAPTDLSDCILTDNPSTNRFRIPAGVVIPAAGFLSFDRNQLGFGLSAAGEKLYLLSPDATRVLDAVHFDGQEAGVTSGRSPDGAETIRRLSASTPGSRNAPRKVESVVLNELMFAPLSGDQDDEYIELHNRGESAVDLTGWELADAVEFQIPSGTILPPGGFLVVGRNLEQLRSHYPQLNPTNSVGNYSGSLANSGERLVLNRPQTVLSTNDLGEVRTRIVAVTVESVTYYGGAGRWGRYSDEGGSSLERIDPRADPGLPSSWADSDETAKAGWTTNSVTAVLSDGQGEYPPNRLHLGLLGMGEAVVDDLEVLRGGVALLANGRFDTGTAGWVFQGNHSTSGVQSSGGFEGSRGLLLRGQGDADTGINSVRANLSPEPAPGQTLTLRVKTRWLAGWPELLIRTRGNWIELPVRLAVPDNLGTPGQPNSRLVPNAGPAIFAVQHSPALPRANQPVVVTCRVSDPDGITGVTLRYRLDPNTSNSVLFMNDLGQGADAVAGDGVYTAVVPGRPAETLAGFTISATDASSVPISAQFPGPGQIPVARPVSEAHIRWGDTVPTGTFPHAHLWSPQATENLRIQALNNTYREATLVWGNSRVIYNVGFRDKGSPYHGGAGSFALTNPDDEPLLGTTERVFRTTGNGGSEDTGIRHLLCSWIGQELGIPYLHGPHLLFYRNGAQQGNVSLDLEIPTRSYARSQFPSDVAGDLYKIAVWFEFQDDNGGFGAVGAGLDPYRLGNNYRLARYRWNWQTRGLGSTANNYTNVFNLITLANDTSTNFVPNLLREVDVDEWMRVFAYHRLLGNWDSFGFGYGQNMYALKNPAQTWKLIPWDIDFTLGLGAGPSDGLWGGHDGALNRWFDTPAFRRMLWRAYGDLLNTALRPERYEAVAEAHRSSLVANGFAGLNTPAAIYAYLAQRRSYIEQQLKANDVSAFALTTNNGGDFTSPRPTVTLQGTAPFAVATLEVNGALLPVTWLTANTFSVNVPLTTATNVLRLVGRARDGSAVPGATDQVTVRFSGTLQAPEDFLVLNEVHYNPAEPDTSFIELLNTSTTTLFDLSGWRLEGVGLTLPPGSILAPGAYGLLVKDRAALSTRYGLNLPILADYPGSLDNDGETLRLVKPGLDGAPDVRITDVRYGATAPWPTHANGFGPSLQLRDPSRGSYRVANWAAAATNSPSRATPGRINAGRIALPAFPTVWINEVLPDNRNGPRDAAGQRDPYVELFNAGTNSVDLSGLLLSDDPADLTRWAFPAGSTLAPGAFLVLWADGQPAQSTATELHLPFRLHPTQGMVLLSRLQPDPAVLDFLPYQFVTPDRTVGAIPDGEPRGRRTLFRPTPGAANDPVFPPVTLRINEFVADNAAGLVNAATGKRDDWFELFNAGTEPVDLADYRLTDDPADLTKDRVPGGFVIPPGGFLLVWADKVPSANQARTDLHADFRLSKASGFIGLSAPDGRLVDSLTYGTQSTDVSQGLFPDGGDGPIATFPVPSPRESNVVAGANQAPVFPAPEPRWVTELELLEFTVTATDPDPGQVVTFSLGADAPAGAELEADTGRFRWTPAEAQGPTLVAFTLRATDNGTPPRSVVRTLTVTVQETNLPPSLPELANLNVAEGSLLAFQITALDSDRPTNTLRYALAPGAPAGAELDPITGQFAWTPTELQGPGTYPLTVIVSDDGQPPREARRTFQVAVQEVDNPPVIDLIPPQTFAELTPLTLTLRATDPDSNPSPITYALEGVFPPGMTLDPNTGVLRWTPTEAQGPATYVLVVRATERNGAHLSAARSFGLTVTEANQSPRFGPLPTLTVREGDPAALRLTAEDPDFPVQGLDFTLLPGAPVGVELDPTTGWLTWLTPDDRGPTTHEIAVRVEDRGPSPLADTGVVQVVTQPRFRAVINEVQYRPLNPGAGFIEFFNPSTLTTQNLTGVTLTGENLRYSFPAGARLDPGQFLVLAQNRTAFAATHGPTPVFAEWSGTLDRFNTLLTLDRPDGRGGRQILQQIDYRATLPWPVAADEAGGALQLRDARRDGSRIGNWAAANALGWRRVVQTGTASSSSLYIYLETVGEVYLDDLQLVAGTEPEVGPNLVANGDFEGEFPGPFLVSDNHSGSSRSTAFRHGGVASLRLVAATGGTTRSSSVFQDLNPALSDGATYTLSYWYLPNPAGGRLTLRLSGSGIRNTTDLRPDGPLAAVSTPGRTNSTAVTLPEFPPVWLNEVAPDNRTGLSDAAGQATPWIELINRGPLPVDLSGWALANQYTNPGAWRFPSGSVIPPQGFLIVFATEQPKPVSPGEWRADFRLPPTAGGVTLARPELGGWTVVDWLEYSVPTPDQSFGRIPRQFPALTQRFLRPTPGQGNLTVAPRLTATVSPNGSVTLGWATEAGTRYRVEFRHAWTAEWLELRTLNATASSVQVTDSDSTRQERYYRVVVPE